MTGGFASVDGSAEKRTGGENINMNINITNINEEKNMTTAGNS